MSGVEPREPLETGALLTYAAHHLNLVTPHTYFTQGWRLGPSHVLFLRPPKERPLKCMSPAVQAKVFSLFIQDVFRSINLSWLCCPQGADPLPLPLRVAKAGRNPYPPPPHGLARDTDKPFQILDMQRSCADVNSPYKRKCWTILRGPLIVHYSEVLPGTAVSISKEIYTSNGIH